MLRPVLDRRQRRCRQPAKLAGDLALRLIDEDSPCRIRHFGTEDRRPSTHEPSALRRNVPSGQWMDWLPSRFREVADHGGGLEHRGILLAQPDQRRLAWRRPVEAYSGSQFRASSARNSTGGLTQCIWPRCGSACPGLNRGGGCWTMPLRGCYPRLSNRRLCRSQPLLEDCHAQAVGVVPADVSDKFLTRAVEHHEGGKMDGLAVERVPIGDPIGLRQIRLRVAVDDRQFLRLVLLRWMPTS